MEATPSIARRARSPRTSQEERERERERERVRFNSALATRLDSHDFFSRFPAFSLLHAWLFLLSFRRTSIPVRQGIRNERARGRNSNQRATSPPATEMAVAMKRFPSIPSPPPSVFPRVRALRRFSKNWLPSTSLLSVLENSRTYFL